MMKKIILVVSIIMIGVLLLLGEFKQTTFLGAKVISSESFYDKTIGMTEVDNQIAGLVRFEDSGLVYDAGLDEYYITTSAKNSSRFIADTGVDIFFLDLESNPTDLVMQNKTFQCGLIFKNTFELINLKITTLPILDFIVPHEDADIFFKLGQLRIIDSYDEKKKRQIQNTYQIQYKLRGASTLAYPKKPYRFEILDDSMNEKKISLLGMRADDDWNLTPHLYEKSKIREMVCFDILKDVSKQAKNNSILVQNGRFCEVFINSQYIGLYQLTEAMDAKKIDISKQEDVMYEIGDKHYPSSDELRKLQKENEETNYSPIRVEAFPSNWQEKRFEPIITYIEEVLENSELDYEELNKIVDMENFVDTAIFRLLINAQDNEIKNAKYVFRNLNDEPKLFKYYFDFNYTFGDVWNPYAFDVIERVEAPQFMMHDNISDLLERSPAFYNFFVERYEILRSDSLSLGNIASIIEKHYMKLLESGVYFREFDKWQVMNDHQAEVRRIYDFVEEQINYYDKFFIE